MKNLLIRLALPILLIASAVFLLNGSDQKSLGGEPQRTHYCAQEHIHESWLNQDPSHYFRQEAFERQLRQYMETQSATAERNQPPPYTLPVVVHIVHDGGVENLSDAQILQGIQDLNNAFANTGYYDQGTGVNTEIQFCLARRDPDGNTTNGITRDQDALTDMVIETDDIALKDLNRWEPTSYINIWLVRSITSAFAGPGVAGYAYFPTAHGQPEDGIVMEANFFGSSQGASGVIIHEMGHYLGLYHTFQGGCANNDCLADGDRVCDTPPDQSTAAVPCNASPNSCNTDTDSGFATDQPDMFINYMDYGDFDCYSALTAGQTDRMHFSIENVRQSLLESNGCLDPCTINITADFTASATTINAGESVTFTNSSSNATDYDWQIDGVSFSNDTDPTYQFNNVGTFQVILYATNSDPNCLATDTVSITVNCPTIADFTGAVQFPNVGQTLNFTNTSTGATSYEWLVNGVSQSTNTNFDYTFSISGNYTICLDAVGPFCDDTECATVFVFDNVSDCQSTFIKTFGLPNISDDGFALSESDNGGFFMAGGSGNQSMIIKIDPTGTVAWARTLNLSPQDDQIRDIKLDSDGMMIGCGHGLGGTDVSFFFKYDHINDNILWVRNITNPDSRQLTILEKNPGGNYVATGQMDGCSQASILELDRNNGNIIWHKDYALGNCQTFSKAIIANGSIFTTGRYNFAFGGTNKMRGGISRIDFNGDQIWSRLYLVPVNPNNARIYPNGILEDNGHLISISQGDDDGTSIPDVDIQLYSVDFDGNAEWAKKMSFPAADTERARSIVNLPDGYLLMAQADFGILGTQICLIKTDKDGNVIWARHYGGPDDDDALSLLVNNGFIHFIGRAGTGANAEFYLARLNLDGETLDPCDQIFDLEISIDDFQNPYDGFHPMSVADDNNSGQLFSSFTQEVQVEETPICESPCLEICDNGIDDDNDGYVDCYDDECPCNTEVCTVTEIDQNFSAQLAWQSTVNEVAVNGTPIVANLDPQVDSVPEIISIVSAASATASLSQRLLIFKGDGTNAANPQLLPIQGGYDIYSAVNPAVGDVDRNGIPEVVMISGDRRIRVYTNYDANTNPAMEEWIVSTDLVDNRNRKPYLADFNGDGISEVYVGDDVFQFDFSLPTPALRRELNGGSSAGLNYYDFYGQPNCSPVAVDLLEPQHCNGDPDCDGLELVAGNVIYSVDLLNSDGDGFQIKVQRDLNIMQNQFNYRDGYTSVADVNLDGILDVIVSSGRNNDEGVYVWDRNGVLAWFEHQPPPLSAQRSGALACVADVYDDTQEGALLDFPEIIVSSQGFLNCYSLNADALGQPDGAWWIINTTDFSGNTGATVFDFNGDGSEEIIYRDEDNLRIMYGGAAPFPPGVDPNRNWSTFICGSGTFEEHPVIADVDNDRQAEIAVTGYTFSGTNNPAADYRGRLRVFEADLNGGDPWMSARPIWNQFNYFVTNINDDLTLPIEQQLHHLELPQVGSNVRPLNKFVAQIPLLDNNFEPYLPVPDATITTSSPSSCNGDSILVVLTICNQGSASLPAETPITFYLGNPTFDAVAPHYTTALGTILAVDSCLELSVNIPAANGTFFVVANDDGSQSTPYDLGNDFPFTGIAECNYINNPASFSFNYDPPPPLDLGPDQFFCNNGVANLDAGPGWSTYRWQDGFPDQTYTAWEAGTYWVEVADSCGRVFSDTVVVEIDSANQFDLGPDTTLCLGQSLTLDIPGFEDYEWLPTPDFSCTDCNPVVLAPTIAGTYTLVARDVNGCISVDSLQIQIGGFAPVSDTIQICPGDSALIFGVFESEPGTYVDTLPNATGCDTILTTLLELLPYQETSETIEICSGDSALIFGTYQSDAGTYSDTITSSTGCPTIQTITLVVRPPLSDNISISPNNSCSGLSDGGATVSISGNIDPLQFAWSNNTNDQNLENVLPGTYQLTVTDIFGCSFIDSVTILETDVDSASFQTQAASCFGSIDGAIWVSTSNPGTRFSLDGLSYTDDTLFTNLVPGTFPIYTLSASGCELVQQITIDQPPPLVVALPPDETVVFGDSIQIIALSSIDSVSYSWSPADWLSCPDCPNPWSTPFENVIYTLTITDSMGCTATDEIEIQLIRDLDIYVPSGFSPNNDGVNDRFTVFAGQSVVIVRRMMVFDRWGELVFERNDFSPNDLSLGWNGHFRGEPMNPAVFTWLVEVEYIDGSRQATAGDVTLIR